MAEYHQIGKYVLLRELPETPLGRNFRSAEMGPTGLSRIVHLTRLINEVTSEIKFQTMLSGKFFGAGKFLHEGISKGYEVNNIGGLFISQENVEGFSIKAIIKRCVKNNLPFSLDYTLYTASKICNTLEYAHNQMLGTDPMIHGGITPYNVYITFDGDVKIQDWSVVACADYMATARNIFLQRYQLYLAPEQVEGKPVTPAVDIFQVGLIFYEMITGNPLFTINRQENVQQMIEDLYTHQRIFDGKTPPPEMLSIISKSLSLDPAMRYPSIRAMREELDTLLYSGVYLATATKTSFFINSIYKEEIKNLKTNLESELNMSYADYILATATPSTAQQGASGQATELTAEEISAQILPDTGKIQVEDEGIGTEVGVDFISYTRKKQSRLIPTLLGVAGVIILTLLIIIITGRGEPEVKTIDTPEALARKAELEQKRVEVQQKEQQLNKTAEELRLAQERLNTLETDKTAREQERAKLVDEGNRIKAAAEEQKRKDDAEREKKAANDQAERDRLAKLAAEMDKGSSQPAGKPPVTATTTANPTTSNPGSRPATTPAATSSQPSTDRTLDQANIPYVRGDDPNLVMNVIDQPRPVYPKTLARAGIRKRANVVMFLYIGADGRVEKADSLSGEALFVAEAKKVVMNWRFTPPVMKDGKKVRVTKAFTLSF
jgi:serine/threonine protein kinase